MVVVKRPTQQQQKFLVARTVATQQPRTQAQQVTAPPPPRTQAQRLLNELKNNPNAKLIYKDGELVQIKTGGVREYRKNTRYPEQGTATYYPDVYVVSDGKIVEHRTQDVGEAGFRQRVFTTSTTKYAGGEPSYRTTWEWRNQSVKKTGEKDLTTGYSRDFGSAKHTYLDRPEEKKRIESDFEKIKKSVKGKDNLTDTEKKILGAKTIHQKANIVESLGVPVIEPTTRKQFQDYLFSKQKLSQEVSQAWEQRATQTVQKLNKKSYWEFSKGQTEAKVSAVKEKKPTVNFIQQEPKTENIFKKIQTKYDTLLTERKKEYQVTGDYLRQQKAQGKPNRLGQYGAGLGYLGLSTFKGFTNVFIHPIESVKGVYTLIRHPITSTKAIVQQTKAEPVGTIGEIGGGLLAFKTVSKGIGAGVKAGTKTTVSVEGKTYTPVKGQFSKTVGGKKTSPTLKTINTKLGKVTVRKEGPLILERSQFKKTLKTTGANAKPVTVQTATVKKSFLGLRYSKKQLSTVTIGKQTSGVVKGRFVDAYFKTGQKGKIDFKYVTKKGRVIKRGSAKSQPDLFEKLKFKDTERVATRQSKTAGAEIVQKSDGGIETSSLRATKLTKIQRFAGKKSTRRSLRDVKSEFKGEAIARTKQVDKATPRIDIVEIGKSKSFEFQEADIVYSPKPTYKSNVVTYGTTKGTALDSTLPTKQVTIRPQLFTERVQKGTVAFEYTFKESPVKLPPGGLGKKGQVSLFGTKTQIQTETPTVLSLPKQQPVLSGYDIKSILDAKPTTRLYPISLSVQETNQANIYAVDIGPISEPSTAPALRTIPTAETSTFNIANIDTRADTETEAKIDYNTKTIPITQTETKAETKTKTETKTRTKTETITEIQAKTQTTTKTTLSPITLKIEKPPTPKTPAPVIPPAPRSKPGSFAYAVEVRRGGVFKEIGRSRTLKGAFLKGKLKVEQTAGASLRIKPLGDTQPITKNAFKFLGTKKFYQSKKEQGVFIQKREHRISTGGEKGEITRKGLLTLKLSRGKNKKSIWGL